MRFCAAAAGAYRYPYSSCFRWARCPVPALARDKTDVIILTTGDHITGEIKKLEYGLLEVSTDNMGTLDIEWTAVASVQSNASFDVETIGGRRYYGSLATSEDDRRLVINTSQVARSIAMEQVSRVSIVETGFWKRVDGSLALGYTYTKASGVSVASLSVASSYEGERVKATIGINAGGSTSPDTASTDQAQISSMVEYLTRRPRFWLLLASLERNEALGIETRTQGGAALARRFWQRKDTEITGFVGLSLNREWATGADENQSSVEGVFGGQWRIAILYPSLSESGRYRGSFNISLRREIISDLFVDLSIYNSYDSHPPDEEAEKNDYGVVTSVGYSF